jgi:amino acid transporter
MVQRKVGYIWNLILSGLMFLQSFMLIMVFFLLVMINISLIIHFRKVDRSTSESDMKGYTWESNLIAVAVGIVFALSCLSSLFLI